MQNDLRMGTISPAKLLLFLNEKMFLKKKDGKEEWMNGSMERWNDPIGAIVFYGSCPQIKNFKSKI
jgi:hypothetical protein